MPKRELLHEWMHRFETGSGSKILRVWTQRSWPEDIREYNSQHTEILRLADRANALWFITGLPFVNAVEELDEAGNGRLVYVDWP